MWILHDFFKGVIIGFVISAPLGPIGILCIKRALTEGRRQGYATGLGALSSDLLYATVAAFGVHFIIRFLMERSFWICLVGGIFLIGMGVSIYRKKISFHREEIEPLHLRRIFTSAFLLNIGNPFVLIVFLAVFSGFGFSGWIDMGRHLLLILSLLAGLASGGAAWWFFLTELSCLLRKKMHIRGIRIVNKISAALVVCLGLAVLLSLFFPIKIFNERFGSM